MDRKAAYWFCIQGKRFIFIPFSLIWQGMLVIGLVAVSRGDVPWPAVIVFTPFLAAGFYVTIGRIILDSKRRANIIYGITDNRIIIRSGIFSKTTNSLNIKTILDISITEKPDGSGTFMLDRSDFRLEMIQGMALAGNR
ncbi:MAG: hypothetical protein JWR54_2841 [Mucilaginibacter sp.]|nr:hypothetical protein [Mucilaginibacter sp.]